MKTAGPKSHGHTRGLRAGTVEVHIEELVLHGFGAGDRFPISDAVEQELTRLLAEQDGWNLPSGPLVIERLNGGTFKVAPDGRPAEVGWGVARAVHGALGATLRDGMKSTFGRVDAGGDGTTVRPGIRRGTRAYGF